MKLKLIKKFTFVLKFFLIFLTGCTDSTEHMFVDSVNVDLLNIYYGADYSKKYFDILNASKDKYGGRDITRAGAAFTVTPYEDNDAVSGCPVRVEVGRYGGESGHGLMIWDQNLPDGSGRKYGNLIGPKGVNHKVINVKADPTCGSSAVFYINWGDPYGFDDPNDPLDYDWELPGPGADVIDDWVEAKITIPQRPDLPTQYCWASCIRWQYANMWWPEGAGVFASSLSGLGCYPGPGMGLSESGEGEPDDMNVTQGGTIDNTMVNNELPRKSSLQQPLPLIQKKEGQAPPTFLQVLQQQMAGQSMDAGGLEYTYLGGVWMQYVYDYWLGGWFWAEPPDKIALLWLGDPNNPNDANELATYSEPYAFLCGVRIYDANVIEEVNSWLHTLLLVSKDDKGVHSIMPVMMQAYNVEVYEGGITDISFISNFILPMQFRRDQGIYFDVWKNAYTFIYVPVGGRTEIKINDLYGDFNFDRVINFKDFALFAMQWQRGIGDPNYDLLFDADGDGRTSEKDLAAFAGNWLKSRELVPEEGGSGGDFNNVEDFDSYASSEELWNIWIDGWTNGTCGVVYLDQDYHSRDGNSMEYSYDNSSDPYYSEAYADIADLPSEIGSDWTAGGAESLSLWFYGQADNNANEQMYVTLTDGGGRTGVASYGAMNDVKEEKWHQWNIVLQDFVDDNNVNLADVSRITIGFGDGSEGGAGTLYFDDIRLYPPR